MKTLELILFDGCPHAARARKNLTTAPRMAGRAKPWSEWNLIDLETPNRFRRFGSPTVLVDGVDVTGQGAGVSALACRADGAPEVAVILDALREGRR